MGLSEAKHFSKEQMNRIFPFHFEIDEQLNISAMGPSMLKLAGHQIGLPFSSVFSIQRPYFKELDWLKLCNNTHELFIIQCEKKELLFRGQFEYIEKEGVLLFIGSQWVRSIEELETSKMVLSDFALHDPTFDLLHIIKNIEINADEIKDLLHKLKEKSDLLKRSEAEYKATLNMASEIIYRTNENGFFTYVNPAAERLTGYNSHELLKMKYTDLIRPDYRKKTLSKYLQQVNDSIDSSYYEFPIITKTAEEKWLGQSVQLRRQGTQVEFVALAIDITKQKFQELALIESNKKLKLFQTLIDNTTDAIQVATEEGQLVYLNIEASKRLGIPIDDVQNYNVTDFEKTMPNSKAWFRHLRTIRNKGPLIVEGINSNISTGKTFPVEVTVGFFEINEIGYIIANSRDITERKIIEESLKIQREKYQSIITNMNLGLVEVDLNDKIQYTNPCFESMSGFTKEELIGKKAGELFIQEQDLQLIDRKTKDRMAGQSDMYEIKIKIKNGEERWWMISGAPNYNAAGEIIGSIGIHLDVTESKALELNLEIAKKRAEESSRAKEAFLANMSHEIRTPLNAIIGMIRELSREKLSEKQAGYLTNTSIASHHLLSVLNNVLDMSKIEAGELQIDAHDFDLKEILNDVRSIMIGPCNQKNLYFKIKQIGEDKSHFIGDAARLRQILLNLVGNAVKFTHSGGVSIEYTVGNLNNHLKSLDIAVKDSGIGMDQTYIDRIFNKFSQEDLSVSRNYGGSGLGMAITKELVQLMNGQIKVESEKNYGSTISLHFEFPEGNYDSTIILNKRFRPKEKLKILLVEDNEFNRIVAKSTLTNNNCEVVEAFNGLEAILILKQGQSFDLILMDLQMPVMDGFESARVIINELKINTPIIALTANAFKSELEHCQKIGMKASVTKPFEEAQLMETIYQLINQNNSIESTPLISHKEQQTALYSIDKLTKLFNGDKQQIIKMIDIFIQQIETSTLGIKEAYTKNDLLTVSNLVHKIKPSIDSMGIVTLKEVTRFIEKTAKENQASAELESNIQLLLTTLQQVIEHLKADYSL